jgi:DNA-binding winged helix-turn-helix (wHTH) protein
VWSIRDKIKLQERPFQILAALLERPGVVVTREEIQQKLWPTSTFVDFEHSTNTAVNKLRGALGDDVDNPRFIETLLGYGYRLIALSKNIPRNGPRNRRSLGYARDDKGEGDASKESGWWTKGVFHHLGWAAGP